MPGEQQQTHVFPVPSETQPMMEIRSMATSCPASGISRQASLSSSLPADDPPPQTAKPTLSSTSSLISQCQTTSLLHQALPPCKAGEQTSSAKAGKPSLALADAPATSTQSQVKQTFVLPEQVKDPENSDSDDFNGIDNEDEDTVDSDEDSVVTSPSKNKEKFASRSIVARSDEMMAKLIKDCGDQHGVVAGFYKNLGKQLRENGEYKDALRYFRNALEHQKTQHGDMHPKTAKILSLIAETLMEQSEHKQALVHWQDLLTIQKHISGVDHPDTAHTYRQIGATYGNLGNYAYALVHFRLTLSIYKNKPDIANHLIADVYNQVGIALNDQGKVVEAVQHYRDALAILEGRLGTKDPNLANLYHNYAIFLEKLGKLDEAHEYYRREQVIRQIHS